MALTVETAVAAGVIASAIQARQEKLAQIDTAIAQGWSICKFSAIGPDENEVSLIIDRLNPDTSAAALNFAKTLFEAQIEALNAQLAAL